MTWTSGFDCPGLPSPLVGRTQFEQKYAREHELDFLGIFSIEYFVSDTNSMIFLPILDPCGPDLDPHLRLLLFEDMARVAQTRCHFSLKSMNRGFPLRILKRRVHERVHPWTLCALGEELAVEGIWDEYVPGQGQDDAQRELDLAIYARTFFHGPMPELMKAQAWFCTVRGTVLASRTCHLICPMTDVVIFYASIDLVWLSNVHHLLLETSYLCTTVIYECTHRSSNSTLRIGIALCPPHDGATYYV